VRSKLFLLVLLACAAEPATLFTSGPRLRAQVYVADGGAQQLHGTFDTARGELCAFRVAEDGVVRCLPADLRLVGAGPATMFADAACTKPVAAPAVSPKPAYLAFGDPCAGLATYALGDVVPASAPLYAQYGGACTQSGVSDGQSTYFLGAKVPASAFASAVVVREPRGDLEMQMFHAEDGSRFPLGAYDPKRLGSCGTTNELSDRCAPSHVGYTDPHAWADATCTTPIMLASIGDPLACTMYQTSSYDAPDDTIHTLMVETASSACPTTWTTTYFDIDTTTPVPAFFVGDQTQCTPAPATSNVFLAGAPVSTTSFPEILHVSEGAGRLVARVQTSSGGDRLLVEGFSDTQLGTTCRATVAEDGVLRCLPYPTTYGEYAVAYADAQCTTPIYVNTYAVCDTFPYALELLDDQGTYRTRIVKVGDAITPAAIYTYFGVGHCVAGGVAGASSYFAATIVPPDTFAPLTDTTL